MWSYTMPDTALFCRHMQITQHLRLTLFSHIFFICQFLNTTQMSHFYWDAVHICCTKCVTAICWCLPCLVFSLPLSDGWQHCGWSILLHSALSSTALKMACNPIPVQAVMLISQFTCGLPLARSPSSIPWIICFSRLLFVRSVCPQ